MTPDDQSDQMFIDELRLGSRQSRAQPLATFTASGKQLLEMCINKVHPGEACTGRCWRCGLKQFGQPPPTHLRVEQWIKMTEVVPWDARSMA